MPRATAFGDASVARLNAWIDADADRMLSEMLDAWYPGYTRVKGVLVSRAIRSLYKEFQREQRRERGRDEP